MGTIKITSWNVAHLDRLTKNDLDKDDLTRRNAVVREIQELSPDVLCLLEGPKGEESIDRISNNLLGGEWVAVKASDGEYATQGNQWIWFLVHKKHKGQASLLPVATWDAFASGSWKVNFWGEFEERRHQHFRHPQVLVFDWHGLRVEFVGLLPQKQICQPGREHVEGRGHKA
jgi:hypothetical protein